MNPALKSLKTPLLELHYLDSGPADAPAVILLHGWPDGAETWNAVIPALNAAGWRTIAPYLRGFGPNRFLDADTPRSGQITAIAQDVVDLADALELERYAVAGHDWGARTAYVLAAQEAPRVTHCVALSVGYGPAALTPRQAQNFWYQWFFALPQGEAALRADAHELCRHLWREWSPTWRESAAAFEQSAPALQNPDWLDITLHGYRHRWGLAEGDPRYAAREAAQASWPRIGVPTLVLHGEEDRCIAPASSLNRESHFGHSYARQAIAGAGHFPQREAPVQTARLIRDWLAATPAAQPAPTELHT